MITLRNDQMTAVQQLREGLRDHQSVLLQAACGFGKCLGKDTPVLMYDGTIKMVQDVVPGDRLMGPDSKPRRVLSICSGTEMLYRVTPKKGDPYVVNESHILSLRRYGSGELVNLTVTDYLKRVANFRATHGGWRAAVRFKSKPLEIDPYFFGLWLGDGTTRSASVTTGDLEVLTWLSSFAESNGLSLRIEANSPGSVQAHITAGKTSGKAGRNPVLRALQRYGLIQNKHVPLLIRTASRADCLQVLAGYLDADGSRWPGGYDATSVSREIADGIAFIARSLGFGAYVTPVEKTCGNNGVKGTYFRCSIHGPVHLIPCKVERKKSPEPSINKDPLRVGIAVSPIGPGEYFGFEIDGDRLFMLGDFTVTHNTVVASYMAAGALRKRKRFTFGVHRRELAMQTARTLDSFGIPYGYIMAGMPENPFALVQIASAETLKNRPHLLPCDIFVPDEAHLWGDKQRAELIEEVMTQGSHVVPLTATPARGDGKPLRRIAQHMVQGPPVRDLIARGHLARYKVYAPVRPDLSGLHTRGGEYVTSEVDALMGKPGVCKDALHFYRLYADGKRMIGYTPSRARGEAYAAEFTAGGVPAAFIDGETPDDERRNIIESFADRRTRVLFNCQLFREGFDLSAQVRRSVPIECVGLYTTTQSTPMAIQMMMRGMRPQEDHSIILDHGCVMVNRDGTINHGFPDDDREWSLDGEVKRGGNSEATIPTVTCSGCYCVFRPQPRCPYCGMERETFGREIEEFEAHLAEIDPERARLESDLAKRARDALFAQQKKEEREAGTSLKKWEAIAAARGYNRGWAFHKCMAAKGRAA